MASDMQRDMTKKYSGKGVVFVSDGEEEDFVPPAHYIQHAEELEKIVMSGDEIFVETIWGYMTPVVNSKDTIYQVKFSDRQIKVRENKIVSGRKQPMTDEERKYHDSNFNAVAESIEETGDIAGPLAKLAQIYGKMNAVFHMMVKGGRDENGIWKTNAFVYVLDDYMHISDIDGIRRFVGTKHAATLTMFFERMNTRTGGMKPDTSHLHGVRFGEDQGFIDERNYFDVMGTPYVIGDPILAEDEDIGESKAVTAKAFSEFFFGKKPTFLNNDIIYAMIILSHSTSKDDPKSVDDMVDMVADLASVRDKMVNVKGSDPLYLCLARAHMLANLTSEPNLASEETQQAIMSAPTELRDEIITHLRQEVASFAHSALDGIAIKQITGAEEFIKARDSNDPKESEKAQEAFRTAKSLRKSSYSWLGLRYNMLKESHRGLTPTGGDKDWTFRAVKESRKDDKEQDLFEKICEKIIFGQHIDDVVGLEYGELIECYYDTMFAWEHNNEERSFNFFKFQPFKPSEQEYLKAYYERTKVFILIYFILGAGFVASHYKFPSSEEGKTDEDGQPVRGM